MTKKQKNSKKSVRKTTRKRIAAKINERDSTYFLKIVMYIILGSLWIKFAHPLFIGPLVLSGLPVGLMIGVLLASRDPSQIDRKIEYALLIIVAIMTYFLPAGIVL